MESVFQQIGGYLRNFVFVSGEVYKYKEYSFGTIFNKINLWRSLFIYFSFQ